ncbi:MAG: arsenite methyltransferase [Polyangiales bacterium]|jgi:arsenite methyltransferase
MASTIPSTPTLTSTHAQVRSAYSATAQAYSVAGSAPAALAIGYTPEDLEIAGEANLGIGCGNPHALAQLQEGEVVVDLGSGAGFDALIAAPKLGESGRFIGVDMTPAMLERARTNAVKAGVARNVEFREGLIEALPIASGSVDVVISNCVINLSPDKDAVFREMFRVLKAGGRIAISDIVLDAPLPEELRGHSAAWNACLAGALPEAEYLEKIRQAGFVDLSFERRGAGELLRSCGSDPLTQQLIATTEAATLARVVKSVFSYSIRAKKN